MSFIQNETNLAKRRVPVVLVDAAGNGKPGQAGAVTLTIAKNGGAWGAPNVGTTFTEDASSTDGDYTINFAVGDWDTVGLLKYKLKGPNTKEFADSILIEDAPASLTQILTDVDATLANTSTLLTNVAAIPTNPLRTNDVRLNNLSNLDATVSTRATAAAVAALPTASAIVTAMLTAVLGTVSGQSRTVQGVFRRIDWFMTSAASGLFGSLAKIFQYDGTTVGFQATQDAVADTRTAATGASGAVAGD